MAAKIKDGLFIGDAETSQSEIFINDNKISNLINLSGREVPGVWASHGLVYLTYNWEDRPDYRLFTGHEDSILTDIVEFVDVSIAHGISVLLFSKKGTGRCAVAACLYLMVKYRWGFEKSYDYVYSKKPDIDLNKGFIQQMFALDMKLVASRQKAYALKHGIENSFKIEPAMTINDIAAMLPPNEAKRWNSWDPSYVLTPNNAQSAQSSGSDNIEDVVTWQRYAESVISALKKKDQIVTKVMTNKQKGNLRALDDAEEELVLIFSFINAKNTIDTLPGPYYNAYDVPKQFTLRFESTPMEEDIHMFPTSPPNYRYTFAVKGILKGSRAAAAAAAANSAAPSKHDHGSANGNAEQSKRSDDKQSSHGDSSQALYREPQQLLPVQRGGSANIRNSIDLGKAQQLASSNNHIKNSTSNGDELLKYVGLSAQSKDETISGQNPLARRQPPPKTTAEDKKAESREEQRQAPLTAEERLRKLMAEIQNAEPAPSQQPLSVNSNNSKQRRSNGSNNNADTAPSLYDLANMHVTEVEEAKRKEAQAKIAAANNNYNDYALEDFDDDDDLQDPLSAFDVPVSQQQPTSSKSGGGALRARHDILSSSGGFPPARSGSGSSAGGGSSGRPGSASSRQQQQAWGTMPASPYTAAGSNGQRYTSPASGRGSAPPSSNNSVGSNSDRVGSGATSGSQAYRHGSPAPNYRPNNGLAASGGIASGARRSSSGSGGSGAVTGGRMSPLGVTGNNANFASSNNSVASNNSLGGSSMQAPPPGYASPAPGYGSSAGASSRNGSSSAADRSRYTSPFVANLERQQAPPQRRSSGSSVASAGSAGSNANNTMDSAASRRKVQQSPMRASYGSAGSGGGGGGAAMLSSSQRGASSSSRDPNAGFSTSKRFSTPTPQAERYSADFEITGSRPGSASSRSGTPSKQTWKF